MKSRISAVLLIVGSLACRQAPASQAAAAAKTPADPGQPPAAAPATPGTPAPAAKPVPAQLPAVIATVNGDAISRDEFESAVHSLEARNGAPVPADRRDEILRGVLDQLVSYHLLEQEATTQKVTIPDAELNSRLAQVRQQFPDQAAFDKALASQGTTEQKLKDTIRQSLMVTKVLEDEIGPKVNITDKDVQTFYDANKAKFVQGEAVRASHILITVAKDATPAQKAAAKAKAEALLKQIKAGADFATLAKANSQDPGSAKNGGDLGFFEKGEMVPAFDQAAFALKVGEVSGVVESPFGFHIIKVTGRRPEHTLSLAETSSEIKDFLTNQERQKQTAQLVDALRKKSKIDIFI
ncbi:MAG TPA: peptidylprolyl isomerase [Vicinamibacterales bacterium]|nr:peptidylprolyl isomerase [Vicinamibacterales bacterium]